MRKWCPRRTILQPAPWLPSTDSFLSHFFGGKTVGSCPPTILLPWACGQGGADQGDWLMKPVFIKTTLRSDRQLFIQRVASAVLGDAILVILMLVALILWATSQYFHLQYTHPENHYEIRDWNRYVLGVPEVQKGVPPVPGIRPDGFEGCGIWCPIQYFNQFLSYLICLGKTR